MFRRRCLPNCILVVAGMSYGKPHTYKVKLDALKIDADRYRDALQEIARLTAPGGFPHYPLLLKIAIKALKPTTEIDGV